MLCHCSLMAWLSIHKTAHTWLSDRAFWRQNEAPSKLPNEAESKHSFNVSPCESVCKHVSVFEHVPVCVFCVCLTSAQEIKRIEAHKQHKSHWHSKNCKTPVSSSSSSSVCVVAIVVDSSREKHALVGHSMSLICQLGAWAGKTQAALSNPLDV